MKDSLKISGRTTVNKKILISLVIFLGVFLICIVFMVLPLLNETKGKSEEFIFQKKTLSDLEIKTKNLKEFQATYKNYLPNLEKLNNSFINSAEPIGFMEFLEKEASFSDLLVDISPSLPKEIKDDPWMSMNFQLTLAGSFSNFLKFLEKLESGPYLIEILNFNARKLAKGKVGSEKDEEFSEGDITANLAIKVYAK